MDFNTILQQKRALAELCQAQGDELAKCRQALVDAYNERDDTLEEMSKKTREYQTKIDELIRQRDRTQDLLARERVRICHLTGERDAAHAVIRDLLGAIFCQLHSIAPPGSVSLELHKAQNAATDLLAPYITEDG